MRTFEKEWQHRFERFAIGHEADHLVSGWSEIGLRRRLSLFKKLIRERKLDIPLQVLDIGCGAGTYVQAIVDLGHSVVGLDYSIPSLSRALAADPKRAGRYIGGETYHLPFSDECFDIVISIGVLQVLSHIETAVDEMARVLRPRGLLIVDFLNAFELVALAKAAGVRLLGRSHRLHTYSPFRMQQLIGQRGFRVLKRGGIYLPPRRLPWLERIFDLKAMGFLLEVTPGLSLALAHAFLLIGEKGTA